MATFVAVLDAVRLYRAGCGQLCEPNENSLGGSDNELLYGSTAKNSYSDAGWTGWMTLTTLWASKGSKSSRL